MKYKKEFLEELAAGLKRRKIAPGPIVEYYGELIDERIASGTTEKDATKELGAVDDIIREVAAEEKIKQAVKKPTISNGAKALIACLVVLSSPIAIPLGIVLLSLIFVVLVLLFTLIVTAGSLIVGLIFMIAALLVSAIHGDVGIEVLLFCLGVALVVMPLMFEAIRGLVFLTRAFVGWLIGLLRRKSNKKGEGK